MRPYTRFTDSIHMVSSEVFVTPSGIAPRSSRRCVVGADCGASVPLRATTPAVLGMPTNPIDSLIVQGTPRYGGSSSSSPAAAIRSSAASASSSAAS